MLCFHFLYVFLITLIDDYFFKNYFGMISVFNYALLINESWRHDDDCVGVMDWNKEVNEKGKVE